MNPQTAIDRMRGRDPEKAKQVRSRLWYQRWQKFSTVVERGNPGEIMLAAFSLVEACKGHNSTRVACSSREAVDFILEMKRWKQ